MLVSIQAIPMYTMLPPFAEWFIRKGYTLCYAQVDTVGWPMYAVYFVMYMASVEVRAGLSPLSTARRLSPAGLALQRNCENITTDTMQWRTEPALVTSMPLRLLIVMACVHETRPHLQLLFRRSD